MVIKLVLSKYYYIMYIKWLIKFEINKKIKVIKFIFKDNFGLCGY